ncbi:Protein transport protein SEC31-like B [Vitis vinifera]|uniref:Protein transport protein SEC31-like B n=1 Tax=Vitis vinifera TaxID=29760 RepID=A0A438DZ24_VITVI|nr:Protein transport protein SEC31-like B [Vitis vinifera]
MCSAQSCNPDVNWFQRAANRCCRIKVLKVHKAPLKAPKWYKRPAGVSFGFGGKLVSFHTKSSAAGASTGGSEVHVHDLVTEQSLVTRSSEFEAAVQHGERSSLKALCDRKSQESESSDDRETWGFLKVMFEDDGTARSKLLTHLGFDMVNEEKDTVQNDLSQEVNALGLEESTAEKVAYVEEKETTIFPSDNGEDFFNNLPSPKADTPLSTSVNNFVVEETATVEQMQQEVDGQEESADPAFDECVQRALVVGDYKGAVAQCMAVNKMADALVIAHVGGSSLWESTRDQYLKMSRSPYLKVVSAMVNNDLMSLVNTRPLKSWKETLALLCTFAPREEWTMLCDTLASKLMAFGNTLAATLCYICAGNIDKTVEIWSRSLTAEHEGKSYVDVLQDLMEKTIVLALATGQKRFSASLYKLVEKYSEILASQGLLKTAMEYLKLLGSDELSPELVILRDRIALSTEPVLVSFCFPPVLPGLMSRPAPHEELIQTTFCCYRKSGRRLMLIWYLKVDMVVLPPKGHAMHCVLSHQEKEVPKTMPFDNSQGLAYGADQSSYGVVDSSQHYYQETAPTQMQSSVPGSPYGDNYQQPFGTSYGSRGYVPPAPYQPAPQPHMFLPSQAPQVPQENFAQPPVTSQPAGATNSTYQSGPPGAGSLGSVTSHVGTVPGHKLPQVVAPTPTQRGFMPVNSGVVQRPGMGPMQPPSPTQQAPVQPAITPAAPPPTIQTVDTSNVPAQQRPVVATLTRLFNETSEALGGSRANPAKKREIEDNSRKIGALLAKLNSGDISKNAADKLVQLCQALDNGDFGTALQFVLLTTSEWDECNFWLATLKRMIKTRQNVRLS